MYLVAVRVVENCRLILVTDSIVQMFNDNRLNGAICNLNINPIYYFLCFAGGENSVASIEWY